MEEPAPGTEHTSRVAEDTSEAKLRAEVAELRQFREMVMRLLSGTSTETPTESLAELANEHFAALTVTAGNLGDLGDTIELLSRNAGEIDSVSDEPEDAVADAETAARDAVSEVHRAQQAVRELSSDLESLQSAIGDVEDMLIVIHRISDQTNMLALNASIEAARVGTAGDGFAVRSSRSTASRIGHRRPIRPSRTRCPPVPAPLVYTCSLHSDQLRHRR